MEKEITIILADDHPLLRKGLKDIIEEQEYCRVIGEAGDGEEALRIIESMNPEISIIDIHMPGINGLEVVKKLQERKSRTKPIILTMYDKENIFNKAMESGIRGYVMKDSALTEIVEAIKFVSAGRYYISSSMSGFLVNKNQINNNGNPDDEYGISRLTVTERKILRMIADNMTTNDIADELFVSIYTVQTHRSNICQKLKLHGPNALLHFCLEHSKII